jgi:pumilio RNA-binding family
VQFVLEHGKHHDRALIISKLRGQMLQMARHKFASNVCEKALITADPENRRALIDEIMTPKQDGVSPIVTMMKDQFASTYFTPYYCIASANSFLRLDYVLQRALTVVEGDQKEILISKVRPQLAAMRRYSSAYSRHLAASESLYLMTNYQSADCSCS